MGGRWAGLGTYAGHGWVRLPGLADARRYQRSWLRGDLLAGLTVSAYLIPQVLAYAGVAGLPPVAGLWAAAPPLLIYALLGSSRSLSMGPESSTALMTAVAIGPLAAGSAARYAALATTLALLVGLLAVVAGLLRLGFIADLLSRPVIVGYLAGLAVIMIAGQLGRVTGVPVEGRTFLAEIVSFGRNITAIEPATTLLAAIVLAFLFIVTARWPALPGPLIAVIVATVAVWAFGLTSHGVTVVGPVPAGLPPVSLPTLRPADLRELVGPAFTVLVIAFSDVVLTGRALARKGERVDANQELLALGTSNIAVSFMRGFPVSSSASRTALGQAAGSRTQLYSVTAAGVLLAVLAFGHGLIAKFPLPALGALVIFAAVRLIDVTALRRLVAFRRRELMIALVACVGVLAFNILYGVLVAIGISVAELLIRVARPHDAVLGQVPGLAGMHDVTTTRARARSLAWSSTATTLRSSSPTRRTSGAGPWLAAASESPLRWFVLNVEANVEVDFTALEAVEAVRDELTSGGAIFALARAKQDLLAGLTSFGLAGKIGDDLIFPTLPTAVDAYRLWAARPQAEPVPD